MTQNCSADPVKVIHGSNDELFYNLRGVSVSSVRSSLADAFNIPFVALAFINGQRASVDVHLCPGDLLEFAYPLGSKGSLPVNEYGSVVTTSGVPEGFVHVDEPRLGPTCRRLGIEYAPAVIGWQKVGKRHDRRLYPKISGIVIHRADLDSLQQALAEKAEKSRKRAAELPLLTALFTLNRRAKRCRDLAQTYYQSGMYGLAGKMKREKKRIYHLKGQVLHHLVEAGVLVGGKYHRFEFGVCAEILEGGGYTFHRPCPPQVNVANVIESIEAKPKGSREPSLLVAFEVINNFLEGKELVSVYQWPPRM